MAEGGAYPPAATGTQGLGPCLPELLCGTCPTCGHECAANRPTQAVFHCILCGFQDDADRVGAINVLSRGMQVLRDEGTDTADASAGCAGALSAALAHSPDRLRSEWRPRPPAAGTRRGDLKCL